MGWLGWWVSLRLHVLGVHFATGCAWNAHVRPSIYIYIYIYHLDSVFVLPGRISTEREGCRALGASASAKPVA